MGMRQLQFKGCAKNDMKVVPISEGVSFRACPFSLDEIPCRLCGSTVKDINLYKYRPDTKHSLHSRASCIPPSHMASFAIFQVTLLYIFGPMQTAGMLSGAEMFAASVSIPPDRYSFGHAFAEPENS